MNRLAELGFTSGFSDILAIEVGKANIKIAGSKEQQKRNGNIDLPIKQQRSDNTGHDIQAEKKLNVGHKYELSAR